MPKSSQESYLVSFDTFVLEPILIDNRMGTRILEKKQVITIPRKPIHSIRNSCRHYGNSFQSAVNSSKVFLKNRHKVPIVVAYDYGNPLIFLPTMSPTSDHNIWIALHAIINLESTKMGCIVHLENNYSIKVNVSASTIYRQHTLGTMLKKEYVKKYRQLNGSMHPDPYNG